MARPGSITLGRRRPMPGVKRTSRQGHEIDANDPKRLSDLLIQASAAQGVQKELALPRPERQIFGKPAERNVWLNATQVLQRRLGKLEVTRHGGRRSQLAVVTNKVGTLTDALARQAHRLIVIAADEFRIGANTVEDRGERITRAQ